jgi:hypothetical protein
MILGKWAGIGDMWDGKSRFVFKCPIVWKNTNNFVDH